MSLDTPIKHSVMPGTLSNSLKRKRVLPYLSSPPPELHDLQEQEQEQVSGRFYRQGYQKEQAMQTELDPVYKTSNGPAQRGLVAAGHRIRLR